jgi:cellulose synthase/poly-beta-1,6-N-acetylglucosamine synthase-like glycosyltransferase
MDSIAAQTRPADEIILCDGGSTDHTLATLREYAGRLPLKIIERPGANISQGRNAAIHAAAHDLIAVTDAGVRLEREWLARIVEPLESDPTAQVVAGFFQSDPLTPFELALGATTLPELSDINPAAFNPSSRSVAFRRAAFDVAGGYPEWLDFCEDLILDFRLRDKFGVFAFAPGAVAHFRPRQSLRTFFRQYFQYARGDGKANLFFRRHAIRYLTYLVALPLIVILSVAASPWWLLALLAGALAMMAVPYRRLINQWHDLTPAGKMIAALCVPVIRVGGDIAKMIGYPFGVAWRWRNHPPDWRDG